MDLCEEEDANFLLFYRTWMYVLATMKSRAVLWSNTLPPPPPTSYALLQEKTDLKLPPANWLRENPQLGSAGTTVLGSSSKSKPFSRYNDTIAT